MVQNDVPTIFFVGQPALTPSRIFGSNKHTEWREVLLEVLPIIHVGYDSQGSELSGIFDMEFTRNTRYCTGCRTGNEIHIVRDWLPKLVQNDAPSILFPVGHLAITPNRIFGSNKHRAPEAEGGFT